MEVNKNDFVYKNGFVEVDLNNKLYYECFGNCDAEPILFIHGGPGSGFSESHKKLFDPQKHNVIFYDQRGAGKSQPYLSLEKNTTENLVKDINILLDFLCIRKVKLFGASWGSTLALLYAMASPQKVSHMMLVSVFLATKKEYLQFIDGSTQNKNPSAWQLLTEIVPKEHLKNVNSYYLNKLLSGTEEEKEFFAKRWAQYDIALSTGVSDTAILEKVVSSMSYKSLALLTAFYIENKFFIEDNFILQNIEKVSNIPTLIIHSKDDNVTDISVAQQLKEKLTHAQMISLEGDHASQNMYEEIKKRIETFF